MRRLTITTVLVAISSGGCGSADPATAPAADGGSDAPAASDAPSVMDEAMDGPASLGHCPADVQGPALALVRWQDGIAFCIDRNEVTNADYAAFLAGNVAVGSQGGRCGWNQTFVPEALSTNGPPCPSFDPRGRADYPVVCVDWCDAAAYCHWAGKHLCQKPGGARITGAITAKNPSEWVIACTGDGKNRFPYGGDTASPGLCVDHKYPAPVPGLRPVKEAMMCEGGVPGVFDMSGNAWEWQDDCDEQSGTGADDPCPPLGGSFSSEPSGAACTDGVPFFRRQVGGDAGFRCCVDAAFF